MGIHTVIAQVPCIPQGDIKDCFYYLQWHLKNTGQNGSSVGEDIDIEPVWMKGYKGEGTYIAVVDGDLPLQRQSIDLDLMAHPDLIDNISTQHSVDYYPNVRDTDSHATGVAGVLAARDNDIGVRGVAPRAKIYNFNILGDPTTPSVVTKIADIVDAMTRHSTMTTVSNNSWGSTYPFSPSSSRLNAWRMAIESGIEKGFYGKGIVYVWAAGNERCISSRPNVCNTDNSNYDGYTNYHAVIPVCAVDDRGLHATYSEFGANLWVCAPSIDSRLALRNGIVTTRRPDTYTGLFSGTSASTPMVSGVVALMRQANPDLGWRDVKLILANSARQNDATDDSWMQGAVKYGAFATDTEGQYRFSHKYGFGVVNASRAVELAENWVNLPARSTNTYVETFSVQNRNSSPTSSILMQSDINFIEFIEIYVLFAHNRFYDLSIQLTSPSGNVSELTEPATESVPASIRGFWRFGSARHLGEDPSGLWNLTFVNTRNTTGTLIAWGLQARGYQIKIAATADESLSEANIENNPLTLSLVGAQWKQNLQADDFRLKNAPSGLVIKRVLRISDTQAELMFTLNDGFADDYIFEVEATTATISNYTKPLASEGIALSPNKPTVVKTVTVADAAVGSDYEFTIDADTFESVEPLTYGIDGLSGSGLVTNGLRISGVPTTASTYHVVITATTLDGNSTATSFNLRVRPRGYPIVIDPTLERIAFVNKVYTLDLNNVFADSDMRSTLRYSVSGNPHWLHYDGSGILSGSPNQADMNSRYKIVVTATDGEGHSTHTLFNLRIVGDITVRIKIFLEGALK